MTDNDAYRGHQRLRDMRATSAKIEIFKMDTTELKTKNNNNNNKII